MVCDPQGQAPEFDIWIVLLVRRRSRFISLGGYSPEVAVTLKHDLIVTLRLAKQVPACVMTAQIVFVITPLYKSLG